MKIKFNKPYIKGNELEYIRQSIEKEKISGDGEFTSKCHAYFQDTYGFKKVFLTTSGTDALEMGALLLRIEDGDEVIMPSFTFVSTANAFVLRGAKLRFVDVKKDFPNIDPEEVKKAINFKTKAIVVVHYGGIACPMEEIMDIAKENNLYVVEDAAQAIDSYYDNKPLGSIGDIGIISFHESKNIVSGEGGLCIVNNEEFVQRAEIIWEKGTNRKAFNRGEVNKYTWVDIGSSFLPSELNAAFLYGQLENLQTIQRKRKLVWNRYFNKLRNLQNTRHISLPQLPDFSTNNSHIFFFLVTNKQIQTELLNYLNKEGIKAIFHYIPLHNSPYFSGKAPEQKQINTMHFSNTIVRLPMYCELSEEEQDFIIGKIQDFFRE